MALSILLVLVILLQLYQIQFARRLRRRLSRLSQQQRRQDFFLFRQIEDLWALYRETGLSSLPPTRRYSASPDFLRIVMNEVRKRRPKVVLELGSGISTAIVAQQLKQHQGGHLYSLEDDQAYLRQTQDYLQQAHLAPWVSLIHAPLEAWALDGQVYHWYAKHQLPTIDIDLIVMDGPALLADRYCALPALWSRLTSGAGILLDDADRAPIRQILQRWQEHHPHMTLQWLTAEKGCCLIQWNQAANTTLPQAPYVNAV